MVDQSLKCRIQGLLPWLRNAFFAFFDTFCIVYNQYNASFTYISTYFSSCPNGNKPVDLDFRVKGTDEMIKTVQIKIDLSQSSTTAIIY